VSCQPVAVDRELPPRRMPARILDEIFRHALDTGPEECCGLVSGDEEQRYRRIYRCRNEATARHLAEPDVYPRDGRRMFVMNELDYQRASEEAVARGERITAVYHSHVGSDLVLSALDQEYACHPAFPFPDADQIVIAVRDGRVAGAALFERDPGAGFAPGRRLEAEPA